MKKRTLFFLFSATLAIGFTLYVNSIANAKVAASQYGDKALYQAGSTWCCGSGNTTCSAASCK